MNCTYKNYNFKVTILRLESYCKDLESAITRVLDFMVENKGKFTLYDLEHQDKHIIVELEVTEGGKK